MRLGRLRNTPQNSKSRKSSKKIAFSPHHSLVHVPIIPNTNLIDLFGIVLVVEFKIPNKNVHYSLLLHEKTQKESLLKELFDKAHRWATEGDYLEGLLEEGVEDLDLSKAEGEEARVEKAGSLGSLTGPDFFAGVDCLDASCCCVLVMFDNLLSAREDRSSSLSEELSSSLSVEESAP